MGRLVENRYGFRQGRERQADRRLFHRIHKRLESGSRRRPCHPERTHLRAAPPAVRGIRQVGELESRQPHGRHQQHLDAQNEHRQLHAEGEAEADRHPLVGGYGNDLRAGRSRSRPSDRARRRQSSGSGLGRRSRQHARHSLREAGIGEAGSRHRQPCAEKPAGDDREAGRQVLFNSQNTFEDIKASVRLYGKLLGKESKAEEITAGMDRSVGSLKKPASKPKTLIVYGAPGSFVVALPTSYPGSFLELAGGENVASKFPKMDTMPQYAELSMERIVASNPELILLITHGDAAEVKAGFKKQFEGNAAWKSLPAVKNDRFEVLPQDLFAANPGIRAPKAIETINNLLLQVD
ncbi:hypothetical protein BN871_FJ_00240 [Paenibacillus sp. P22]|nr:hypothetical protein BN871_FJ_00240 [Paenibacillus sp. P22]